MRYRKLGTTNIEVSEVGLGTMTFGWTADEATSHQIMDAAVEAGITFLDTADMYSRWATQSHAGYSEEIIGRWLRHQQREKLIIATKVRGPMSDNPDDQGLSRRHIIAAVEGSLRRLQTDYIDVYQTHWPDDEVALEETLRAFDDLQHEGKIRAIGCSNSPASYIVEALSVSDQFGLARFQTLQPHYNLVHRAEFERELRAVCSNHNISVIPYSPLAGGFLSGKYKRGQAIPAGSRGSNSDKIQQYIADERNFDLLDQLQAIGRSHGKTVAQTALAWLIDAPAVTAPIIGANSVAQLHDTLGAVGYTLSVEERQQLDALSSWQ